MHTVRLSLFCAAALLASGVYANDFSDALGASAKTADFVLTPAQDNVTQPDAKREQRQQTTFEESRWLRVSDQGQVGLASREPRLANKSPRWVF
ncbi:conserved exported hypothetical protein [Pseudomonas sp. 8Z]|uniref:hypothetical protein n=1 Tax=Pseudomonas sp. 8Z TaxID=2653166 RepID=UPI0012F0D3A4|nr:hypothetical protein [Pseudomonas sp. 8Z]VXD03903.1 conserved exported hypothetical protein [Pseudomonas sp. 8Z]